MAHFLIALAVAAASQQVLDRVLARVDASIIMLSDLRAAVALGIVDAPGEDAAFDALLERRVMLAEVARFPAPEPTDEAIAELADAMKQRAGSRLPSLMESTGLDDASLTALARDTLRIPAYVRQRFGAAATRAAPVVRQWLRAARARATVVVNK